MNNHLIYSILETAVIAGLMIYWRIKDKSEVNADSFTNPKETEDGKFAIQKPADEDMDGLNYEEIRTNPKFKQDQNYEAIPNPSGPPPKGPIR